MQLILGTRSAQECVFRFCVSEFIDFAVAAVGSRLKKNSMRSCQSTNKLQCSYCIRILHGNSHGTEQYPRPAGRLKREQVGRCNTCATLAHGLAHLKAANRLLARQQMLQGKDVGDHWRHVDQSLTYPAAASALRHSARATA